MWRAVLASVVGFVAWMSAVALLNQGLRLGLPGYAQAEPTFVFTLPMKIARLTIGALGALSVGAVVRAVAPASRLAPWGAGLLLLIFFVPIHVKYWSMFPAWYHLTFLITLAPLGALGAALWTRARSGAPIERAQA